MKDPTWDETLAICERTTAQDWVYWVYIPLAGPGVVPASPAAEERGAAVAHFARAVYRADVSVGLAWGVLEGHDCRHRGPDPASPDPRRCHWIDVLRDNVAVERYLAIAAEGGQVMLPAPRMERREDGEGSVLWVSRRKLAVVRLANEIDPACRGFDDCFARSGIEVR
jgi:hypothetical protein